MKNIICILLIVVFAVGGFCLSVWIRTETMKKGDPFAIMRQREVNNSS